MSIRACSVDAGRTAAPNHCGAAAWPLVCEKQRLPRKVFRRSIAWLLDWLSTLRSAGYPRPTQDSLPAAGQALPDGLSTRKIPLKGFRVVSLHLIPLSQASCRNHIDLQHQAALSGRDRKRCVDAPPFKPIWRPLPNRARFRQYDWVLDTTNVSHKTVQYLGRLR